MGQENPQELFKVMCDVRLDEADKRWGPALFRKLSEGCDVREQWEKH